MSRFHSPFEKISDSTFANIVVYGGCLATVVGVSSMVYSGIKSDEAQAHRDAAAKAQIIKDHYHATDVGISWTQDRRGSDPTKYEGVFDLGGCEELVTGTAVLGEDNVPTDMGHYTFGENGATYEVPAPSELVRTSSVGSEVCRLILSDKPANARLH